MFCFVFFLFFVSFSVADDGVLCYNPSDRNFTIYTPVIDTTTVICDDPPTGVSASWTGNDISGSAFTFSDGCTSGTPDTTYYNIQQRSRPNDSPDTSTKSSLTFKEGNGIKYLYLCDTTKRAYWIYSNQYTENGIVIQHCAREVPESVWAATIISLQSSNAMFIYSEAYEYFSVSRYSTTAFLLFVGLSDEYTRPYIASKVIDGSETSCLYMFTTLNCNIPGVSSTNDFVMLSICQRSDYNRYVMCPWTQGSFADCTCTPKSSDAVVYTTDDLTYPDCHYLSSTLDLVLQDTNSHLVINSYNTSFWQDVVVSSNMNELIIDIATEDASVLSIGNSFDLPSFSVVINGGLSIDGTLTFGSSAGYVLGNLSFSGVVVDTFIESNTILCSARVSENEINLFKDNNVISVCGSTTKRFVKDPTNDLFCDCETSSDTDFTQFDCNYTSLETDSNLTLILGRTLYDGKDFDRHWNSLVIQGNGYRELRGKSHTILKCVFAANKNYIINTTLNCDYAIIESGVQIHVVGSFNVNTLELDSTYNNLNEYPIINSSTTCLDDIQELIFTGNNCVELVASSVNYGSVNQVIGDYTIMRLNNLLRICKTSSLNYITECSPSGSSYPTNFELPQCPCFGSNCVISIPSTIQSIVFDENSRTIDGTIVVAGDLKITNLTSVNIIEISSSNTVTFVGTGTTIQTLSVSLTPTIIAKCSLVINDASGTFSLTSYASVYLSYDTVSLGTIVETTTNSIIITPSVNNISISSYVSLSERIALPLITIQPSDNSLTFNENPTGSSKIIAETKVRNVLPEDFKSCGGQVVLGNGTTSCSTVGIVAHTCHINNGIYTISSTDSGTDYSCPCTSENGFSCSITIADGTSAIELSNDVTDILVSHDITITSQNISFILIPLSPTYSVIINGAYNAIQVNSESGFQIESTQQNIFFAYDDNTFFVNGGTKTLKTATTGVIQVATVGSYCDSAMLNPEFYCLTCNDLLPVNGVCEERNSVENCEEYATTGHCLNCYEGYYLQGTVLNSQTCIDRISTHCKRFDRDELCILCEDGYSVVDGSCSLVESSTCVSYSRGVCLHCLDGTKAVGMQECSVNCNSTCETCYQVNGVEKCVACDISNLYSQESSSCYLPTGASSVSQTNIVACSDGYQFVSSECSLCSDGIIGCELCENGVCYSCTDGYILNQGICKTDTLCQSSTSSYCLDCGNEYYYDLTTGQCAECGSGCAFCDSFGECLICLEEDMVSLDSISCIEKTEVTTTNCLESRYGICYRCENGYYPKNTQCLECSDNCLICDNSTTCLSCMESYELINGSCHTLQRDGCAHYSDYECIRCNNGYYLEDGYCYKCDSPCLSCSSPYSCKSCRDGYYIFGDSCLQNGDIDNCIVISSHGCGRCEETYYVDKDGYCSTCDSLISHCSICNATSSICKKCKEDYILVSGECTHYSTISNCKASDGISCSECSTWHALAPYQAGCESKVEGWLVALIIWAITIVIGVFVVFVVFAYHILKMRSVRLEQTRKRGIFSLKHCKVLMYSFASNPELVCSATELTTEEKLKIGQEHFMEMCVGNQSSEITSITFTIEEDKRYSIYFNPPSVVLKPGMCSMIEVIINPKCSFKLKSEISLIASVENKVIDNQSIGIKIETQESSLIDPNLLNYDSFVKQSYALTIQKATYQTTHVLVRNIGIYKETTEIEKDMREAIKMSETFTNSSFIANYIGKVLLGDSRLLVTESSPMGTVQDIIDKNEDYPIRFRIRLMLDAAKGMSILHAKNFLHYDIQPSNILLMSNDPGDQTVAKLSGCGFKDHYMKFFNHRSEIYERPTYIAPEIFTGQKYTVKTDIYGFAMTMYAIGTLKEPFSIKDFPHPWDISKFVSVGRRLQKHPEISENIFDIISNSWDHCSVDRYTSDEIVFNLKKLSLNN